MRKILCCFLIFYLIFFCCSVPVKAEPAENIVISEVKITGGSGKSTDEFIELYNPTDGDVLLSGWQLIKKTASGNEYLLVENLAEQIISSHSFLLIVHPVGYLSETQPDLYYTTTNSIADNNTIILLNGAGEEADKVGFGSASDFEGEVLSNPGSNKSLERKAQSDSTDETMVEGGVHYFLGNSEDTDNNVQDFFIRSLPEPQNSQSELEYLDIEIPEIPDPPAEESDLPAEESAPTSENILYSNKIIITELFPNPEGVDDGEFIELFNTGNEAINLSGWQLGDNSSRKYTISESDFSSIIIESGAYLSIKKEVSKISLNNTSDAAKLYRPDGTLLDLVEYEKCQEAQSYSLVDGEWAWTDNVTPGQTNIFEIKNEMPTASFEASEEDIKVGQVINFDASESADPDEDVLDFFWDFGDGEQTEGEKVEYIYQQSGEYIVTLLVRDEKGGENEDELKITVTDYDYSDKVFVNELLPSCSPSDKECEFIELYNQESREVNLDGWQLTDLKKYYHFPDDSIIEPHGYLVIERKDSNVTLNNGGDTVFLLDPVGKIVNGVEYEKAKKDFAFAREIGLSDWHWTEKPTPGEENEIMTEEGSDGAEEGEDKKAEIADDENKINTVPIEVVIGNINEDMLGDLIKVTGEVESAKSTGIYLMDDLGNALRVYIQKKTGIAKPDAEPGDIMTVVGILDRTSAGLRLLPRTEEDITIIPKNKAENKEEGKVLGAAIEQETTDFPPNNKNQQVKMYLFIAAGALVVVLGGVLVKVYIKKRQEKEESAIE
jgi:PKD repeat protein